MPHARRRPRAPRSAALAGALAVLVLGLAGCGVSGVSGASDGPVATSLDGASETAGTDITGVVARPALTLPDTSGAPVDLRARPAGELTVVFLGYTRCPDVCPTTMADLAAARRSLDAADRDRVQVVFVTEDPAHDSPGVVRRWLDRFDTSFLGLIGGGPATSAAVQELKGPQTEVLPTAPTGVLAPQEGPTVVHVSNVYAFAGDRTLVYTDRTSPADYARDFRTLLGA